jgi:hypothetical protein
MGLDVGAGISLPEW